jgi:hypothetical protein
MVESENEANIAFKSSVTRFEALAVGRQQPLSPYWKASYDRVANLKPVCTTQRPMSFLFLRRGDRIFQCRPTKFLDEPFHIVSYKFPARS